MKKNIFLSIFSMTFLFATTLAVSCTDSNVDKESISEKTESIYRDAQEEVCEMVNGKLECKMKRVQQEAKDLKDKVN